MAFRYLGNKTRITDWIVSTISDTVKPGARVADPMCGTAAVSLGLAAAGYRVTAADALRFPVLHARARLLYTSELDFSPAMASYASAIDALNRLPPAQGYFWREFGDAGQPANGRQPRGYFTADNAARIDAVRAQIAAWSAAGMTDQARDLLLHDLILAANDVANIAGTYGYFRATWSTASLKPLQLRATAMGTHSGQHQVMQGNVEDIASSLDVDACYLDPPYTKRQYAGNYHILETLALGDEPVAVGDGGLRDWYPQSSNFCLRRRAAEAFRETLKRLETQWIFISYSEDGQVPANNLMDLLSEFGRVRRVVLDIPRFRSNDRTASSPVEEHLYVLEKR